MSSGQYSRAGNETDALRAAYDQQADQYGRARNRKYDVFRDEVLNWFAQDVRGVGTEVLDLGSGPGHEAILLRELGLTPLAIDFSSRMVDKCRARGLEARLMDLRELDLPPSTFAGAWMSFSLLHLPKAEAGAVMRSVRQALRPGGVIVVLLFEGESEGPREEDVPKFGCARYFAYYRPEQLKDLVAREFDVIYERRLDLSPRPTLVVGGRRADHGAAPEAGGAW